MGAVETFVLSLSFLVVWRWSHLGQEKDKGLIIQVYRQ